MDTYRARVNGYTVILIVDSCTNDLDVAALTDIESVSVRSAFRVAGFKVDGHICEGKTTATINADGLNRRIQDIQVVDFRIGKTVRVEELRLGLSTVAALAVPPSGAIRVQRCRRRSRDGDGSAFYLEKRAIPLLVTPSRCSFEDDLRRKVRSRVAES